MNRDLRSIIIISGKCRLGLLEFRPVFYFVIIATNTGEEEGFVSDSFEEKNFTK